ncbi:MAG: thioredoxin family protein [Planctomycetota bacterium]
MPRDVIFIVLAAGLGIAGAVGYSALTGTAPTPEALTQVNGLDEAMAQAEATDRPVVAVVTADWCPPCQHLKRTTLQDERVAGWLSENAVAVTIVEGQHNDDLARLPIEVFPTTYVIKDSTIVGQAQGYRDTDDFLEFLQTASDG